MKRADLVALAKANGMTSAHSTKSIELVATLEGMGILVNGEPVKAGRGRKIDPTSERQLRLAALQEKKDNGTYALGRSIDPTSERQVRLKELAAKKEANGGVLKKGRNINPNSVRQLKLKAQADFIANGGVVKRGRPAKVVEETKA